MGSFLKARPDLAHKVLEAFVDGIHYYKTHPEEGIAVLRSRGVDSQAAREVYQKVADSYRSKPDPDLSGIKGILDSLPDERAKKIQPGSLVDPTPWERVVRSGYIESLYGPRGVPPK